MEKENAPVKTVEPIAMREAAKRSYLGDACVKGILAYVDKITHDEKAAYMATQEQVVQLESELRKAETEIYAHKHQAAQLEHELDNILQLNDICQESIRTLEAVVDGKDSAIVDNLRTIARLT